MTTRLKDLPGYFNSKEERELQSHSFKGFFCILSLKLSIESLINDTSIIKENVDINQELDVFQPPKQVVRPKTVSVYSNVKVYLSFLICLLDMLLMILLVEVFANSTT